MKHIATFKKRDSFRPLLASTSVQAAVMVLRPGQTSSDRPENEHPKAEQWLFVVSGSGTAKTGRRSLKLKPGSLLLIEKNESHQIKNTGRASLRTINFYAPPAYADAKTVKPSVASR